MSDERGSWLRPASPPSLPIRLLVVGGLLTIVFWVSRRLWFIDDDWDFLTQRTAGDPSSYLRPHSGHWTAPVVPQFRLLYRTVGMDYFPWYHLPRLLAAGLLALLVWRTFDRRGAAPAVATAAVATLVVLDAAAGHRAVSIGNYIVMAALIVVGDHLAEDRPPTARSQVVVALVLLAAVMAFSTGAILLAASVIVILGSGRGRLWWRPVLPVALVYAAWSVGYGPERGAGLSVGDLPEVPVQMVGVLARSQSSLLGIPFALGVVIALAIVGLIAWWGVTRRLDRFDALALLTVLGFLGATSIERLSASAPLTDTDRYGFVPLVGLALVIVPRIPAPKRTWQTGAVLVLGMALVAVNLVGTQDRSSDLATAAGDRRVRVETAAEMLGGGEPAVDDSWVTVPLTVEGLRRLVADGWSPSPTPSATEVREARGVLRIGLGPDSDLDGPLVTDDSCVRPEDGDVVAATFREATAFTASAAPPTRLVVRWQEGDDIGERVITWADRRGAFQGRVGRFGLAGPRGEAAEVQITVAVAEDLVLCPPPTSG